MMMAATKTGTDALLALFTWIQCRVAFLWFITENLPLQQANINMNVQTDRHWQIQRPSKSRRQVGKLNKKRVLYMEKREKIYETAERNTLSEKVR